MDTEGTIPRIRASKWRLRSVSLEHESTEQGVQQQPVSGSPTGPGVRSLVAHGLDFDNKMRFLWDYTFSVGRQATFALESRVTNYLVDKLTSTGTAATTSSTSIQHFDIELVAANNEVFRKKVAATLSQQELLEVQDLFGSATSPLAILHSTCLQQQVNAFEHLLATTMVAFIQSDPSALPGDYRIPLKELAGFGSYEQATDHAIYRYVDSQIRRGTKEQFQLLKQVGGVDLHKFLDFLPEFHELVLRRHAIVHASGKASPEYLRRRRLLNLPPHTADVCAGDNLTPDAGYISRAWCITYATGWILVDRLCRSHHKGTSSETQRDPEIWESMIFRAGFRAIELEQYDAAILIYEYLQKFKLLQFSDRLARSAAINLAQALKWSGRTEEASRLLNQADWTTSHPNFAICAAAIKGEPDTFFGLLPKVEFCNWFPTDAFWNWPVFREMRNLPDYIARVSQATSASPPSESPGRNEVAGLHVNKLPRTDELRDLLENC